MRGRGLSLPVDVQDSGFYLRKTVKSQLRFSYLCKKALKPVPAIPRPGVMMGNGF